MKLNIIQEIFFSLKDWLAGSGHPVNFIKPSNRFLFQFAEMSIAHLKALGRNRTAETYATSLSSFRRFRKNQDVLLSDIDSDMMAAFEAYLRKKGVSPNSSSFYMRNLRAIYNRAVEKELTTQSKGDKDYKRNDSSTLNDMLALIVTQTIGHGQKHRHGTQRIGQCKERSKAQ